MTISFNRLLIFLWALSQSALATTHTLTLEEVVYDNRTGAILKYNGTHKDIVIPKYLNGTLVNVIGYKAFYGKELTRIKMADSVVRIEPFAFSYNNLTQVKLSSSLTHIGYRSFCDNNLTTIDLPASLVSIEEFAFLNNNLHKIELPPLLDNVAFGVFYNNPQ